jgi:pyridoxine 5-phosphate synthase
MVRLSVNINKLATLRNARGGNNPDLFVSALKCIAFGAQGITVHPRPDERHIRYADVRALRPAMTVEFNIEGNPNNSFNALVAEVLPDQVTIVPDSPEALTSNAGWDCINHSETLKKHVDFFKSFGIRTSVFLDPVVDQVKAAADTGVDRIELYTESYANAFPKDRIKAIEPYVLAANQAMSEGLGINAGHDLDLKNLGYFAQELPGLEEVSIGHALICDALYLGLDNTIKAYLNVLNPDY